MAQFIATYTTVQKALDEAMKAVKSQMLERGINEVSGDWGSLVKAELKTWKISEQTPEYFTVRKADTAKLNAAYKAGETVPGTDFKVTGYITPKFAKITTVKELA
jgi:hypothetical protein